jgi:hypothetical protein
MAGVTEYIFKSVNIQVSDMNVNIQIQLSDHEKLELSHIIGCEASGLSDQLAKYASAATEEYCSMVQGKKIFKRGSDMLEYRLLLLIEHVYANQIPSDQQVCRIFQMTLTESRSLIRAVMSKYQYRLKTTITKSMIGVVSSASSAEEGGFLTVSIANKNIADNLNALLADKDGGLQPVAKKKGSVAEYVISPASHKALMKILEIHS